MTLVARLIERSVEPGATPRAGTLRPLLPSRYETPRTAEWGAPRDLATAEPLATPAAPVIPPSGTAVDAAALSAMPLTTPSSRREATRAVTGQIEGPGHEANGAAAPKLSGETGPMPTAGNPVLPAPEHAGTNSPTATAGNGEAPSAGSTGPNAAARAAASVSGRAAAPVLPAAAPAAPLAGQHAKKAPSASPRTDQDLTSALAAPSESPRRGAMPSEMLDAVHEARRPRPRPVSGGAPVSAARETAPTAAPFAQGTPPSPRRIEQLDGAEETADAASAENSGLVPPTAASEKPRRPLPVPSSVQTSTAPNRQPSVKSDPAGKSGAVARERKHEARPRPGHLYLPEHAPRPMREAARPQARLRPRPTALPARPRRADNLPGPQVNVSIGRVEVRAIHAPAAPSVAEPRRSSMPRTSLDDYLTRREADS